MSKYRCPICGASHKEPVANCRLCGQSMSPNAIPAYSNDVAELVHTDNSIKGFAFIGLAVVAVVVIGAVVFGLVRPTRQLQTASDMITQNKRDGWTTTTSEDGKFTVDLPGQVTKETVDLAVTDNGKVVGVTTTISEDTKLLVGAGAVTLPSGTTTGTAMNAAAAQNFLKDTIVPRWLAAHGLTRSDVEESATGIAGYPAYTIKTLAPAATVRIGSSTKEAYASAAFVLKGSTLYVIETLSTFKDASQQEHMIETFGIS